MRILLTCPSCENRLSVANAALGRQVLCRKCHTVFVAEGGEPDEPPEVEEHVQSSPEPWNVVRPRRKRFDLEEPPLPSDLPSKLPGGGRMTAVILCLALVSVLDLFAIVIEVFQFEHYRTANPAELRLEEEDLPPLAIADLCAGGLQVLGSLGTAIAFCLWMYRAHANLKLLRVLGLEYTSGWAVAYFFIPIVNLFRPYYVMQEIYKGSDPAITGDPHGWKSSPGSTLLGFWWGYWIISNIAGQVAFRMAIGGDATPEKLMAGTGATAASEVASILAALCVIPVILAIRQRQQARLEALGGGLAQEEVEARFQTGGE
jgi:hypothetical protein